jgi:thiol-disulfide isomerase/thioredoxin
MKKKIFVLSIITFFMLLSTVEAGTLSQNINLNQPEQLNGSQSDRPYDGYLRIYVVEPISRWNNYDKDPYHFGFLDFALNEQLSIEYLGTYTKQVTWNAQQAGYSNVDESNLMVIAAVFNPEINKGYANPPTKNPFDAHYVDAAAGAKSGETGSNIVKENFTHTVFVEEATATWCPYCPAMGGALNGVYESDNYPFYFVALIADKVVTADTYLENYNLYGYPSAFFDGGKKVLVGGYDAESYYRTRIEQCGKADVHEMDLNISVVWKGNGVIDISVTIINNEEMPNGAPSSPILTGPSSGKPKKEYSYNVTATDPEGGQVWYWIDWGDGTNTSWIGPFDSGTKITESHTWTSKENFTILAKAKDSLDAESDWATLIISVPYTYNIPMIQFRLKLLERFSHSFSILRQLLE